MALVLLASGAFVYLGLRAELTEALDDSLETQASAVARLIVERGTAEPGVSVGLDDPGETFTQVLSPRWRLLSSTPGLPLRPVLSRAQAEDAPEGLTLTLKGIALAPDEGPSEIDLEALQETGTEPFEEDRARVLVRRVDVGDERLTVVAGATYEDPNEALRGLATVLFISAPIALLLTGLIGYGTVRGALRPVERMRRQAAEISAHKPGARLPVPPTNDELARLGRTLNDMLARLEHALERERTFVADASHELRTPLAILRAELDVALRGDRSVEELEAAVISASEEAARLGHIAESLLLLARSDSGELPLRHDTVDVRTLLEDVRDRFAGRAADAGRPLEVDAPDGLVVEGDRGRLEQAVSNLVENALRHGAGGVRITAAPQGRDAVELAVCDEGEGFAPQFIPHAFERFSQAGEGRSATGAGLGLAIVALVATAHQGTVRIDSDVGAGARVALRLPGRATGD
jgi:signal transduction histidine kinase